MKISFYVSRTESMISRLVPTHSFSERYSFNRSIVMNQVIFFEDKHFSSAVHYKLTASCHYFNCEY